MAFSRDELETLWAPARLGVVGVVEDIVKEKGVVNDERALGQKTSVLEVESKSLRYVRSPQIYHSDTPVRRL